MEMRRGLIHIYCGDGKGKTSAAVGLAVRAVGHGFRVGVVQFLKDGDSGELAPLAAFPGVQILSGKRVKGFTFSMTAEEKAQVRAGQDDYLRRAAAWCGQDLCDLLVLDEAVGAVNLGMLDRALLLDFLRNKPVGVEVVLTGRDPDDELLGLADYVSEIRKVKHPYDRGVKAREGIEF